MNLNKMLKGIWVSLFAFVFAAEAQSQKFEPTFESLSKYEIPEWYENARFGIFAHWGPQCQPEQGDWYARSLYLPNSRKGRFHRQIYGDPKEKGFLYVISTWKAENWNPKKLVKLYKRMGASYVVAMANHHDNFDMWNSKYFRFNSVNMGPKRNIIGEWEEAVRDAGMRFGVSVHAANSWRWYEPARAYDALTSKDHKEFYAQNFEPAYDPSTPRSRKSWAPDAFRKLFKQRTMDLLEQHHPDFVYFDDTVLPFYPFFNEGLEMAAEYYNLSMDWHNRTNEAVMTGKKLKGIQQKSLVWDIESSLPPTPIERRWQTDICIGDWHYNRNFYNENKYKSAAQVIQILVDVVSKNGNLCLSIPIRGDGTIDEKEMAICEDICAWMKQNHDVIYNAELCKVFGEGPQVENAPELSDTTFNYVNIKPATSADIRYIKDKKRKGVIYAVEMGEGAKSNFKKLEKAGIKIKKIKARKRIKNLPRVYEVYYN